MKHAGVRATLTLHHTLDDVRALVESLAVHVPAALARGGEAARRRHEKIAGTAARALKLEHHSSAEALDEREWDALLGERGTFAVDGLRFLERAFAGGGRPEDEWDFHYYVVRDPAGRPAIRERGYVKTSLPASLVYEPVVGRDGEWMARLTSKARVHQRRAVLPFDDAYEVEFLSRGAREVTDAELEHLYGLYLTVQRRGRDLNSFPLPNTFLREMLEHPSWELMTLRLRETGHVAAFGAHFVGVRHYAPMIVGLDYAVVHSHGAYRQALRQAILRGRTLNSERVLLGMGATFEKARFGARAQERVAFAQASDHYSSEVLAALAADARSA